MNGVGSSATVSNDTVIGQGPVNYIAQNGIQFGYGSKGSVTGTIVTGNSYTGSGLTASGGIIVVGGSCNGGALTIGVKISSNVVVGNDVGIWLSYLDGNSCVPTLTPPPYLYFIDVTNTNNPTASGNTSCLDGSSITASSNAAKGVHADRHVRTSI